MEERVQKIISQWGMASRREAEELIRAGRVQLNGRRAVLGDRADPQRDCLAVDGKIISMAAKPQKLCLLLHKPLGVVCTCVDPQNRPTVLDLLPPELRQGQGLHPVGRLDRYSSGALLLTNDGELTLSLTHPRYHLPKVYQVRINGHLSPSQLQQWGSGMSLDGETTLPAAIRVIGRSPNNSELEVILREGKNRQIRRLVEQLGFKVLKLHRSAIGSIQLHPEDGEFLAPGCYRFLTPKEEKFLEQQCQISRGLPLR